MNLETLHVLEKHIAYWGDPISMSAYMGNCEPCMPGKRSGEYQQGGYQWRTFYDCDTRTWKVERSEGVFEAIGELNNYLDKWYHKKKVHPITVRFNEKAKTVELVSDAS